MRRALALVLLVACEHQDRSPPPAVRPPDPPHVADAALSDAPAKRACAQFGGRCELTPLPPPSADHRPGSATITGRISWWATRGAAPGGLVDRQAPTCEITARTPTGDTRFARTAADGSYSIPVAAGRYTISLEDCAMCSGNATARDVEVGGGDTIQLGLDCELFGK